MYSIGEKVVYGGHGVCLIAGIDQRNIDHKEVSYYVLTPMGQSQTQFFVPAHNPVAMAKVRYPMSREEMVLLLRQAQSGAPSWIPEDNRRKNRYKELLSSGDFLSLAQMVYTLQEYRQSLFAVGKRFHVCDDNFLRDAKRILDSEICEVLEIPAGEVPEAIEGLLMEEISR